jgi:RNase adaptor protein for sRNA GlmZ degradation
VKTSQFTVSVFSFSYKNGGPLFTGADGGGFVFDCRCLPNPGREPGYMELTGLDREVVEYFAARPEVGAFFDHVTAIVDQAVKNYVARDFQNLMVSFGCTGGQHRSVFMAENLARHLGKAMLVAAPVRHLGLEKRLPPLVQP